ncbi:hypothetical protein NX801_15640 [Streptomyces sp. LP05-1]|uniref:DNA recombination-mediator protein A n=1 Tax=Streptomyces pyxinae TaxID=2970734 RepID=A0ABT2CI29_9ACTN|nr:hypothetical protein [Streptomyces sp. LP05-1]MCS0637068.1 hypothetical protein [Streptomyces sp. LP05-1]
MIMHAVAITGTRTVDNLTDCGPTFATYLGPFATSTSHFFIGGALGIDTLALLWLADHTAAALTVVTPGTLAQQPDAARAAVHSVGTRADLIELGAGELRAPAYHARNRYMVDRSQFTIGFPAMDTDPESGSGTWQTLGYAAQKGQPRLIVPI